MKQVESQHIHCNNSNIPFSCVQDLQYKLVLEAD